MVLLYEANEKYQKIGEIEWEVKETGATETQSSYIKY
jgi:hypothetical protein